MSDEKMSRSLQWYFHPNEIMRLMRVRLFSHIDPKLDLTPKYDSNLKIGVVIGTYGAVPYIDLGLHYLKNVNGIQHILIHDDCSNKQEELKQIAKNYNVDFYSTPKNMWHKSCIGSIGDQNCFYEGLKWAKKNNLDILVKFSRRLIPCYKWIDSLKELIINSNGSTFGSYCTKDLFDMRTECLAMNVNVWNNSFTINEMHKLIINEYPNFAEFWMHDMAKILDGQNFSEKYDKWKKKHFIGYQRSGYVFWSDLLGTCRYTNNERHSDVLWHMYSKEEDYYKKSINVFNDKYTLNDFKEIVNI